MMKWWDAYLEKTDALSQRERVLLIVAVWVVLLMLYDLTVSGPARGELKRQDQTKQQTQLGIGVLGSEVSLYEAQLQKDPNKKLNDRLQRLASSVSSIDERLDKATINLISPKQMAALLQTMLEAEKAIKVLGLESYSEAMHLKAPEAPATAEAEEDGVEDIAKAAEELLNPQAVNESAVQRDATFYKHGMRITIESDYFALISYLKRIEESPWLLFWERLNYTVEKAPKAKITLDVFTMSRDAQWIGV